MTNESAGDILLVEDIFDEAGPVMLTSSDAECDLMENHNLAGNSFVAKPVAFSEFATTVTDLGMYRGLVNRVPPEIRPG